MSQALRQQIETIVSLTDAEFAFVLSHFRERHFHKHQFIVQEGNLVTQTYFVIQGLTKSFYIGEGGKEHIVDLAMDNHWVTDTEAFY